MYESLKKGFGAVVGIFLGMVAVDYLTEKLGTKTKVEVKMTEAKDEATEPQE